MATAPAPFPTFPSVTPPPPFCFGAPPYAPYPFPYPNQPPPPSPSYHAAAYHHHHRFQLPPPSHPNPQWHQGMQQMQPPPSAPGNPWHPHHAAAQPPPPSSPPPRRPPPSSPQPYAYQHPPSPRQTTAALRPSSSASASCRPRAIALEKINHRPTSSPGASHGRPPDPNHHTPGSSASPSSPRRMEDDAVVLPAADERAKAKNAKLEFFDIQARLDQQLARDRTSFDTIQGQLENLKSMVSQLANSLDKQSTHASKPEEPQHFLVVPVAGFVAPQVLGEMPTPNFLQETHGTDPSNCSGHQNPIQITCVSNLSEQNLDEMPQVYGLHNLNRHSMFLADGTEHSFYALPENYPLERATPSPVFDACADETDGWSTEIVHVLADLPEQHRHEQEQHESAQPTKCSKANNTANFESMLVNNLQVPTTMQDASSVFKEMPVYDIYEDDNSCLNCMDEQLATPFHNASENALSEQLLTCFSKAPETEQTSACLNIVTDVLDVTLELQQLDGEKASNCPVLKASDSSVTRSNYFSMEQSMKELRLQWDPGENTTLSSTLNKDIVGVLQTSILTTSGIFTLTYVHQLRQSHWNVFITHERRKEWDPGDTKLSVLFMTAASATKLQRIDVYKPEMLQALERKLVLDVFDYELEQHQQLYEDAYKSARVQILDVQFVTRRAPIKGLHVQMIQLVNCPAFHACYLMTNWTSTTSNGITSYACTMGFIIAPQQGVHDNYNAKQLQLSSKEYLPIWEIDIIFTTFRPP